MATRDANKKVDSFTARTLRIFPKRLVLGARFNKQQAKW